MIELHLARRQLAACSEIRANDLDQRQARSTRSGRKLAGLVHKGVADKQSWNDYGESSYIGPIDGDMPGDVRYYVNNNCEPPSYIYKYISEKR
jgi:hypothetical protein